jgi:diguanylate cyclase (GGDEF)-like protein
VKHAGAISQQITRVLAISATLVVLMCMFIVVAVSIHIGRESTREHAQATARMLATSAEYALSFRDARRATEMLSTFKDVPDVIQIRVLFANRQPFVALDNVELAERVSWTQRGQSLFRASSTVEVKSENELLGYVEVTASEASAVRMGVTLSAVAAALLLLFTLFSGPVARLLANRISQPLAALSRAIREVRRTRDYKLRMPSSELKEVQRLSEDFNALLGVIQSQSVELRAFNQRLSKLAFYDSLTGAANRALLLDRLNQLLNSRSDDVPAFSVLAIDLDGFKQLNDRLGHDRGDKFLQKMTQGCIAEMRPSDTFARMGGDEFLVVLRGVSQIEEATVVAERIATVIRYANTTAADEPKCSASIGIAIYPADATSASELIQAADRAMYLAKSAGGNRIQYARKAHNAVTPTKGKVSL